jgi:hypothetical protein
VVASAWDFLNDSATLWAFRHIVIKLRPLLELSVLNLLAAATLMPWLSALEADKRLANSTLNLGGQYSSLDHPTTARHRTPL